MASPQARLAITLSDTTLLLETSKEASPSHNISSVLKKRLLAYYHRRNVNDSLRRLESVSSGDELQLLTAQEALSVMQRVQAIVEVKAEDGHEEPPLLGTRDLAKLHTLLSVAVKWGLIPLYTRVSEVWIESSNGVGISENMFDGEAYHHLSELTTTFFSLLFPDGAQGRIPQSLITSSILSRHVSDLLLPAVALGWLPESMSRSSTPVIRAFRPLVVRLMKLLSASQAISALGSIISSAPPLHVRNACTSLLTKQLLRPDGVDGLCRVMFSEEESTGDEAQLDKLEQIARILNSVPSNLEPQEYYSTMFPRVLQVLTGSPQRSHRRAAAFAFYRAFLPMKVSKTSAEATYTIRHLLHDPFLRHSISIEDHSVLPSHRPRTALDAIVTLVGNAEPSPTFISKLLSPIILPLYGLSYDLNNHRTVDPQLRESVLGLLKSWAKIVDQFEGEQVLLLVIESGKNWDWMFDPEGNFWKVPRQKQEQPALLLPQNLRMAEAAAEGYDMNIFESFPDPVHLVETLKAFDRGDMASSLFVELFERYVAMRGQPDQDPMKVFHILQIIVQMQQRLSGGTTSNILRRPDKIFPFIHRVLTSVNTEPTNHKDNELLEGDSDDEEEALNSIGPDHDLIETTITLLLSVLEADEAVSVAKYPTLEDISSVLEPLALHGPINLRPIAREATLVLTARLAQTSDPYGPKNKADRDVQEVYQRALKLLQDPMLPVRAHGLLLLRELLSASRAEDQATLALVPSILSIFLQSVQDDDSYIFLNGVQGLAVLADKFGKEILQGLVRDYTGNLKGLGAMNATSHDVEVRTRIGEALSSVIKRCGSALGVYVDLLVPPLLAVIRNADIPTVLRTSSISLLADCVDTWPFALLPYTQDLCFGVIDLLQVETSAAKNVPRQKEAESSGSMSPPATMDSNPTLKNSKIPALRRSATYFLGSYIRATTKLIYDDGTLNATIMLPKSLLQKASITLEYISSTDDDNRVRVMAKEARENLKDLQRVVFGLP